MSQLTLPMHSRRSLERMDGLVALLPYLWGRHAGSISHLPRTFLRRCQLLWWRLAETAVQATRVPRWVTVMWWLARVSWLVCIKTFRVFGSWSALRIFMWDLLSLVFCCGCCCFLEGGGGCMCGAVWGDVVAFFPLFFLGGGGGVFCVCVCVFVCFVSLLI